MATRIDNKDIDVMDNFWFLRLTINNKVTCNQETHCSLAFGKGAKEGVEQIFRCHIGVCMYED